MASDQKNEILINLYHIQEQIRNLKQQLSDISSRRKSLQIKHDQYQHILSELRRMPNDTDLLRQEQLLLEHLHQAKQSEQWLQNQYLQHQHNSYTTSQANKSSTYIPNPPKLLPNASKAVTKTWRLYTDVLKISPFDSKRPPNQAQIKEAYKKQAQLVHPDKHEGDPTYVTKFQELTRSYRYLSQSDKKSRYDAQGDAFLQKDEKAFNLAININPYFV